MPRFYVYDGSLITDSNPIPTAEFSFDLNQDEFGPIAAAGGSALSPVLDLTASSVDNFYNGYNLVNVTQNETRQIIGYVGSTRTCTLDSAFSIFNVTDILKTQDPTTWFEIHLQNEASLVDGAYEDYIVVDSQSIQYHAIVEYTGNTRTAKMDDMFPCIFQ